VLFTVGHSSRALEEFLGLLHSHQIGSLIDIRRNPQSRRHPHFSREPLSAALARARIGYTWRAELGGHRVPRPGSPNTAWRDAGFRGYADHMQTDEFRTALDQVLAAAAQRRTAVMCAEADPNRCHRSLFADAAVARGIRVEHILDERRIAGHVLNPWAQVEGGSVTYPGLLP
jgi:uncharacterized protein (DUF488 family)